MIFQNFEISRVVFMPNMKYHEWYLCQISRINHVSIYTLSDLGDLSNLIGSLSRTIQQYSPPSEWIMCELGFFPILLEKDLLKVDKTLGLTFFLARKDFG